MLQQVMENLRERTVINLIKSFKLVILTLIILVLIILMNHEMFFCN